MEREMYLIITWILVSTQAVTVLLSLSLSLSLSTNFVLLMWVSSTPNKVKLLLIQWIYKGLPFVTPLYYLFICQKEHLTPFVLSLFFDIIKINCK